MTNTTRRNAGLKQMLSARRRTIHEEVQSRIRDGRADRPHDVGDAVERSDADIQEDLDLALLQMRAETLVHINEALVRIEAGDYGSCSECAGEISERRLRAQPFAVRCLACEERREQKSRARQLAERRDGSTLFLDAATS